MTETPGPPEYADVNEAVGEEWEAATTPSERVREVISHRYMPVPPQLSPRRRAPHRKQHASI